MVTVLKPNTTVEQRDKLIKWFKAQDVDVHISVGEEYTVLGLIGDTSKLDVELIESLNIVDSVARVSEPFKKSNRKFHPDNTVIKVGDAVFGNGGCVLIAGPSSVESRDQIVKVAEEVRAAGALVLRGDAFNQYFSPYDVIDNNDDNIDFLIEAKKATGLPVLSEIMSVDQLDRFSEIDIIQVSTRNMQNYELLRELGGIDKPVILKRGLSSTLRELLISAEYVMARGNENVILCERGIRTFETYTRNTLDLSAIPALHELSHLPVIVDPGRALGSSRFVKEMALAAAACGADGIVMDVHDDPMRARYDKALAITPDNFREISEKVAEIRQVI